MAVLYNWNTRVEGRSCFTWVLIYWSKKNPASNNQSYSIWGYRGYYILNIYILSRNVLKQHVIMTAQSFELIIWFLCFVHLCKTEEVVCPLQCCSLCSTFLSFFLYFTILQYYMQFRKWASNIIAVKIYITETAFL